MQVIPIMSSLDAVIILVVILFTIGYLYKLGYTSSPKNNATSDQTKLKLPPGSFGLPLLGESLQLMWAGKRGKPESFYLDRMNMYCHEIFKTSIIGQPTAIPCGAEGNKFIFSNEEKLVLSWWPKSVSMIFPTSLRTTTNEETKRLHMFLQPFLKRDALKGYVGIIDKVVQRHIALEWDGHKEVTVYPLAKRATFWIACRVFLGMDDPHKVAVFGEPFDPLRDGLVSLPVNLPGTRVNRAIKAANKLKTEVRAMMDERKRNLEKHEASPTQDVLSHFLVTPDKDGVCMSEAEAADKILAFIFAGHQSSSVIVTCVIKYLAELPHVYDSVYQEQMEIARSKKSGEPLNWDDVQKMKYSWNVVCEVLRLAPPVQGTFRIAIQEFTYAKFRIPKGWKLFWTPYSTHKNPEYFPNPEKFDPSRFEGRGPAPYTFIPFGGGPRMCPGMEFARLELLVVIHNIIKRFKWKKLFPNEKMNFDPFPLPEKGLPISLLRHPDKNHES